MINKVSIINGTNVSVVYLVLTILRFWVNEESFFIYATSALIVFGNFCLLWSIKRLPINSIINVSWVIIVFLGLVFVGLSENSVAKAIPQITGHIGFALVLIRKPPTTSSMSMACILVITFFFSFIFLGMEAENVFKVSRNFVSVIVILALSLYFIASDRNNNQPSMIIVLLLFLIAMWAIGRAGIASALVFLLGGMYCINKNFKYIIFLIVIPVVYLGFSDINDFFVGGDINIFLKGIERMFQLSERDHREYINSEYFNRVLENPSEFIFGAPLSQISAIVEVGGNPHNSFISLHSISGIFGVILILVASLRSILKLMKSNNQLLLIVLFACMLRSFFDSTAFYGPLDIIIFYCIFYTLHGNKIKKYY